MTAHQRLVSWTAPYHLLQALAVMLWWLLLWVEPWTRTYFIPPSFDERVLLAFALPDGLLLVVGSVLAMGTSGPRRAVFAWIVAGGALYATLYSLLLSILTDQAWLSVLAMSPLAGGSVVCAWLLHGLPVFRPAKSAAASTNLLKTFLQIVPFWGTFLGLLPALIWKVEDDFHIARLASEWQLPAGVILFVVFSCLGLWSALTMASQGGGTPLPLDAPTRLVLRGPYNYLRNPMAVAGLGQGLAVALASGSAATLVYVLAGSLLWNWTARPLEEEDMEERFGPEFHRYRDAVPCWVPRLRGFRHCLSQDQ